MKCNEPAFPQKVSNLGSKYLFMQVIVDAWCNIWWRPGAGLTNIWFADEFSIHSNCGSVNILIVRTGMIHLSNSSIQSQDLHDYLLQNLYSKPIELIEKGALFVIFCFSILCVKPFTSVLSPLKYNIEYYWQIRKMALCHFI